MALQQEQLLGGLAADLKLQYDAAAGKIYGLRNGILTELKETVYSGLSMTLNATVTINHGVLPARVKVELVCTTAINGYAANDASDFGPMAFYLGSSMYNVWVSYNAANVYVTVGGGGLTLPNRPTPGTGFAVSTANFSMRARVYDYI